MGGEDNSDCPRVSLAPGQLCRRWRTHLGLLTPLLQQHHTGTPIDYGGVTSNSSLIMANVLVLVSNLLFLNEAEQREGCPDPSVSPVDPCMGPGGQGPSGGPAAAAAHTHSLRGLSHRARHAGEPVPMRDCSRHRNAEAHHLPSFLAPYEKEAIWVAHRKIMAGKELEAAAENVLASRTAVFTGWPPRGSPGGWAPPPAQADTTPRRLSSFLRLHSDTLWFKERVQVAQDLPANVAARVDSKPSYRMLPGNARSHWSNPMPNTCGLQGCVRPSCTEASPAHRRPLRASS